MGIVFSGYISPIPDGWEDTIDQMIIAGLAPTLGNITIGFDKSQQSTLGLWTIHITTSDGNNLMAAQQTIQSVLAASSVNLDPGSIHISLSAPPMIIDYSAPNAPPLPTPMQPATVVPEPTPVVPVAVLPTPVTPSLPPVTVAPPTVAPVIPVVTTPIPAAPSTTTVPTITTPVPPSAAAKPPISPALVVVGILALLFLSSGK